MGKKIVAAVLCLVTVCAVYGCSFRRDEREEYDPTKRYLYIGNYNGGLGDAWLNALADEYMAEHSDVVIRIENDKDRFADATLLEQMDNYGYDMYFVNAVTYSNYVGRGKMLDITDIVTEDLDGESKSIADKMNPTLKEYYQTDDGKFYAVPFFDSIFGTVYDVDLFEGEGLYYNDNGELMCNDSSSDTKSAGPNGKSGDYDDGLPATFTQWKDLLDTMKYDFSITPYVWTGEYPYYRYRWLTSMWADYEGKSDFDLNMSFDGTYTFDGDSEPTVITTENAYLLQKQLGKKYALDFAEYVIDGGYYYTSSFDSTYTHMMAQHSYLDSAVYGQRIAMIIEGGWWENEARSFFGEIAAESGDEYAFGVRRFAFMPAPKSDDGKSDPGTTLISSTGNSVAFIAANTSEADLAKDFLRFVHTDHGLRTFTRMTGAIRPYDYELEDDDLAEMTHYAKNMWDIYHDDDTAISYVTLYHNDCFIHETSFLGSNWWWRTTVNGHEYLDAMYEFTQEPSLNAENWFLGLQETFSEENWKSRMSAYFTR